MTITLDSTTRSFSSLGGLALFDEMIAASQLRGLVRDHLPKNVIRPQTSAFDKFRGLILGFVAGADCLDDMEKLGADEGFEASCRKVCNPYTYGRFLRDFDQQQIRKLNDDLSTHALRLRKAASKDKSLDFVLDLDSTDHLQHGKKMEGLGYNYANVWGLSSLQAFDQYGIQYWMDVREGGAFTANGASTCILTVMKKIPKRTRKILRADSGFCNTDVFNACDTVGAEFVICMRQNMLEPLIGQVRNWKPNKHIKTKDGRNTQTGTAIYRTRKGRRGLRVLIIRAEKPEKPMFEDRFDYFGFVTSIDHSQMRDEDITEFYRQRGTAELYIRELKNGFDIHHFPCQKLLANKAYGIIAAFAYNLMRYASRLLRDKIPRFSKMLRFRMVHVPCQVVRKARRVIFRFNETAHQEVQRWIHAVHLQFGSG